MPCNSVRLKFCDNTYEFFYSQNLIPVLLFNRRTCYGYYIFIAPVIPYTYLVDTVFSWVQSSRLYIKCNPMQLIITFISLKHSFSCCNHKLLNRSYSHYLIVLGIVIIVFLSFINRSSCLLKETLKFSERHSLRRLKQIFVPVIKSV